MAIVCHGCWEAVEKNTGRRNSATLCNEKDYTLASILVRMIVIALLQLAGGGDDDIA
jgi:hypothetical protein